MDLQFKLLVIQLLAEEGVIRRRKAVECSRKWALANPERALANSRRSYHRNLEKQRERSRRYAAMHPEKAKARGERWSELNPEKVIAKQAKYNSTEKARARAKRYNERHPEKRKEWARQNREKRRAIELRYRQNHPDKYREIHRNGNRRKKELAKVDPCAKLERRLRNTLRRELKGTKHLYKTLDLIGCTILELKAHLESQFEPWMNWNNYGYRGWHIDHRLPIASFNLLNPEEVKRCFHFSNLRPLSSLDNQTKGAKIAPEYGNVQPLLTL